MSTRIPYTDSIGVSELSIGDLMARDVTLLVKFTFLRGHPAQTYGPAEDCEPAMPDEFDFESIKAVGNVWFYNGEDDFPALKFEDGEEMLLKSASDGKLRANLDDTQLIMLENILLDKTITGENE